jgi:hypothetical protein
MLFAYYGHHKCASTWIHGILSEVCREAGLTHRMVVDPATPAGHGPLTDYRNDFTRAEAGAYLRGEGVHFITAMTSDRELVAGVRADRAFHVVRDPRDIIVSAYFSHRNSHPTENLPHLAAHREQLQKADKEEGLFLEMAFSRQEMIDLADWDYAREEILEVKMEDLTARPYEGFLEIFEHLGLMDEAGGFLVRDKLRHAARQLANRLAVRGGAWKALRREPVVTGEMLLGRVYDHRFAKKAGGRKAGRENVNSHYRKGLAGDWMNHFTPVHARHFQEQFGDVLQRMGYETDDAWIERLSPDRAGEAGLINVQMAT